MAKGNMLLGHARGKLGDIVFSRVNGQQVTKAKPAVVANPKTRTQMIARIILNTVSQAYSRMRAITDHSFEGVKKGQDTMSAFMRTNINAIRMRVAQEISNSADIYTLYNFTPVGSNIFAPNSFVVSKGSLPEITPGWNASKAKLTIGENTYQSVLQTLGLQRGDQLTFVMVVNQNDNWTFKFARVILDPTNPDGTAAGLDSEFVTGGEINLPSPRNEGLFSGLAFAADAIEYIVGEAAYVPALSGVIASRRQSNGAWLRSNCTLVVSESGLYWPGMSVSLGDALDMGEQGISSLSDYYLNNAGQGSLVGVLPDVPAFGITGCTVNDVAVPSSGLTDCGEVSASVVNAVCSLNLQGVDILDMVYVVQRSTDGESYTQVASESISNETTLAIPLQAATNTPGTYYYKIGVKNTSTNEETMYPATIKVKLSFIPL